ncbi:helix-turn-helix domain-containing protein [Limibacterium fermenti]|uniref:helix-turn-helix domain-containing protein n=1 Tax=Limibacterium fermenti TaxID=3229863 RepID=UPI000E9E6D9A|nr:transcriptional regulator [Porphyromonadaceae bacterium]
METKEQTIKNTHHGHAIRRYRHALGIKQEALAADMGISQTLVSFYEKKKVIEDDMVEKFAKALNVAPELIKELEEDPVTVIIKNNSIDTNHGKGYVAIDNSINHFDPADKIVELCEKLLEKEQEKIKILEKLLKDRE